VRGFGHYAPMSDFVGPTWDQWLAELDASTRTRAEDLRETFARLGADEPERWARSEVGEDIPQLGRFVSLRAVWRKIERWRDRDAVANLTEDASDDAVEIAARMAAQAAFDVALSIVQILDNEEDTESPEPLPGWLLIECDADGKPTGRVLNGLHESVLWTDPRNIEAEDIRGW
jgi:hypothetical protein